MFKKIDYRLKNNNIEGMKSSITQFCSIRQFKGNILQSTQTTKHNIVLICTS